MFLIEDSFLTVICSADPEEDNELQSTSSSNAVVYSSTSNWHEQSDLPSASLITVQSQMSPSSSSLGHIPAAPSTNSAPTNSFMSWYSLSEPSYSLAHHHHYQSLEYVPLSIPQPEYINNDLPKSEVTPPSREDNEYECNIEQRLFPKSSNNNSDMKPWLQSGSNDICLIKDL